MASQVTIDYHRSFRRTITWRWSKDLKRSGWARFARTNVVNLYHARQQGIPDRVAVKRILANKYGCGGNDVDYVEILSIDES